MGPRSTLALAALALSTLASAHQHSHHSRRQLPGQWYHERGTAAVEQLFKRQSPSPPVGSPQWVATFPPVQGVPSPALADIPPAWLAAYNASKNAGHIPDIPLTTLPANGQGNPTYPPGFVGTDPNVCTATLKCRAPGDVWDAPEGVIGISFDDGPVAVAPALYAFLRQHNIPSTHFMIGRVILGDIEWFNIAFQQNHASIAVHTWSHPLMTTQTDLQQLVEIGWTMQVIHDLTGGLVPRFWRPPLGDCDLRCRAIAKTVFNLTTVLWNQDTEDWQLAAATGGVTGPGIAANLTNWLSGPKNPGLIILEHELTNDTIGYFMNTTYPLAVQHGWTMKNIPDLLAVDWYANGHDDLATPNTSVPLAVVPSVAATASVGKGSVVTTAPGAGTTGAGGSGSGGGSSAGSSGAAGRVAASVGMVGVVALLGALGAAL